MHTYPAWKIWLVAIVMLLALALRAAERVRRGAALQLSRNDRAAVDDAGRAAVDAVCWRRRASRWTRPTSKATGWCCASTT